MISIRSLRQEDSSTVARLVKEAGFPQRSLDGWRWAFFENPEQGDCPPGLVAERDGRPVAMIGMQARKLSVDGEEVTGICGHTFISSMDGRGAGFALARRALNWETASVVYSLNNNETSATLYKRLGMTAWAGATGRKRIDWPLSLSSMTAGRCLSRLAKNEAFYDALCRREWFSRSASHLEIAGNDDEVLWLDPSDPEHARHLDEFGDAVCRAHRIAPIRTAEVYAYQMADPDADGRSALLGIVSPKGLHGLIQVTATKPNAFEPAELNVTDLEIRPGADATLMVPRLINAARAIGRKAGLSRLRMPFSHRYEPLCYSGTGLRFEREQAYDSVHAKFARGRETMAEHWMPTGFESDFFFALRLVPQPREKVTGADKAFSRSTLKSQTPQP